jgi:hypothetical protein
MNPSPYFAEYAGQKLHMDQNKKVVMFGVTNFCVMNGYSDKIVGFSAMLLKDNVVIYDEVYRKTKQNIYIIFNYFVPFRHNE